MRDRTSLWKQLGLMAFCGAVLATLTGGEVCAQVIVPGTGEIIAGEDFEDENWSFTVNWPKSSYNIDKTVREPVGYANNGIFFESRKRGMPDIMKRVPTPEGGLSGSQGALRMQTLWTGVPGRPSFRTQQDDALMDFSSQFNGAIPVSWGPSAVVRVYLPPFEEWDAHSGTTFGMRTSVTGIGPEEPEEWEVEEFIRRKQRQSRGFLGLFKSRQPVNKRVQDRFYPGMWIHFTSKADGYPQDSAHFIIRGNEFNQDFRGPEITQTGWWTLGISFSPDGRAHYFASPGVDDLKPEDRIASAYPQSVQCQYFNTLFFNVCNQDTGKDWSTEWIIDDPSVYVVRQVYREARR